MKGRIVFDAVLNEEVHIDLHGDVWAVEGELIDSASVIQRIKFGYLIRGTEIFAHIDGQFTLIVIDKTQGFVYLVRDKIGTIPLYYSLQPKFLVWGNQIKEVLPDLNTQIDVNAEVIHEYLCFRYISGRNTLFKGIYEVLPAHYIKIAIKTETIQEQRYWEIPYPQHAADMINPDENTILGRIEAILVESVRKAFDHPGRFGIMSSGGVDSSLIVALAARLHCDPLATFFIGFNNYTGDRSRDAQMVADRYHAQHTNFYINAEEYARGLPLAIAAHEEPLNHPGHVGRVLFNQAYQGTVEHLLLGEGVDTMFCGSKIYPLMRYAYVYNPIRPLTGLIFRLVSPDVIPVSLRRHFCMIRDAFIMSPNDYLIGSFATEKYAAANNILNKKNNLNYLTYYRSFLNGYSRRNILEKYIRLNQHPFMVEVLNSEAKFGYACDIRNHYPFLDVELVRYANFIPFSLRSRDFIGKYIIKRLAERYFPCDFVYRPKEGFGVPLKQFFNDPRGMGRYYDLLLDRKTRERGIFESRRLERLVDDYRKDEAGDDAWEGLLWTTINLELWLRIYIDRTSVGGLVV